MGFRSVRTLSLVGLVLVTGCAATTAAPSSDYAVTRVHGLESLGTMSPAQYHSAIEVAYLDGQLTKEEAARAHRRLDRQGL
jgi:outer membrane murein-binding lipoprotein Lpp